MAELAAVAEPSQVPATIATVLGLHQAAGVPIADALAARLARQQLLLVLDNCEHVLDAVAEVCATVLQSADDIRILATSREQLGLPEEARYRLPPLTLPGPSEPDGPGSRALRDQAEAVTLFVERARQVDPDLALDGEAGAAVARLVQRLDGMPLAIELAAARVEALGLGQMLERLDDQLLTSANRAAPARQRSLEAAVDWSYQLLTKPEQRVFRCLSVFPGPFGLDAAEAVAGTDAGPAVLHLVDCSLLTPPTAGPDGRSRYSMLQTLRGYGLRQLEQAGEEPAAAAALAAHALSMAERAVAQLARSDQELSAARWLDAEDATVHQGLAWALDHDPPNALKLALALAPWWLVRGRWVQGYALLQRAAGQADQADERLVRRSGLAGSARPRSVRFHQRRPGPQQRGGNGAEGRSAVVRPRRRPGRPGRGAAQLGPAGRGGGRSPYRARPGAPDRLRRGGGARPDGTQRYLDVRRPGRHGRGVGRAGAAGTA